MTKGRLISVDGRIQTRNYKDQSDRTVYVTEVVCDTVQILEQKKDTQAPKEEVQTNTFKVVEESTYGEFGVDTLDISGDELPFSNLM